MGFWKALGKGALWLVKKAWENPEAVQQVIAGVKPKRGKKSAEPTKE